MKLVTLVGCISSGVWMIILPVKVVMLFGGGWVGSLGSLRMMGVQLSIQYD